MSYDMPYKFFNNAVLYIFLRCSNCFDCPSCGHTLTTRATSQLVSNPDDPGKSTPKKMYYLACGFCRWTTRDVAIPDKTQGNCLQAKISFKIFIFIPHHTIVAGYFGFMLDVRVSIRLSVLCTCMSVCPFFVSR